MRVERWTSPAGKRRLLTTLDEAEAALYRRVTALALPRRPPDLRAFGCERPRGRRPWCDERVAWRAELRLALASADAVVASDVADCYPSIGERAIRMASSWAEGEPEPLLAFLARVRAAGSGDGLPVGPGPSAAIADAVLSIADERARAAGLVPVRWVDDVVFAGDGGQVARAARAWGTALRELGLREHEGKRRTVRDVRNVAASSPASQPERVIMRSS